MDRRQRKTREAIFAAFTHLLSQKDYTQITVGEIIDAADVGRATFYAHFETKDFLLQEFCSELFTHIIDTAMGLSTDCRYSSAGDSVFLHLLRHLQGNDRRISDLLSSRNNEIFLRYFKNGLKTLVESQYAHLLENSRLPKDFFFNHIAATFVETVEWWLSQGMKESPEAMNGYFLAVIEPILNRE